MCSTSAPREIDIRVTVLLLVAVAGGDLDPEIHGVRQQPLLAGLQRLDEAASNNPTVSSLFSSFTNPGSTATSYLREDWKPANANDIP